MNAGQKWQRNSLGEGKLWYMVESIVLGVFHFAVQGGLCGSKLIARACGCL